MAETTATTTPGTTPPVPPDRKASRGFSGFLLDFFSSVRLAVILLILLALVSIIGTVLAQGEESQENVRFFGDIALNLYQKFGDLDATSAESVARYQGLAQDWGVRLSNLSRSLGFDRLYNTWYFNLLLGLLSANLVVCSLRHWPHTLRYFRQPRKVLDGEGAAGVPLRREFALRGAPAASFEKARLQLAAKGYRAEILERDDGVHLFAQRGLWGRLGVYVVHLSILVILLGAVIGLQFGKKGFVGIDEGSATDSIPMRGSKDKWKLPFAVRCDDFEVSFYPNSRQPKDYKSTLTVLENGREVLTKTIEVNDPLIHRGVYFYQSSYGETGRGGMLQFTLRSGDGKLEKSYQVPLHQPLAMPEFGVTVQVVRDNEGVLQFVPDFAMEGNRIVTRSNQAKNPAVALKIVNRDGAEASTWMFRDHPDYKVYRGQDYTLTFDDYKGQQYTGLQVAYDPGVPLVYLGCFLMVVGIFLSFFMPHKRLWLKATPVSRGGHSVWFAGSTSRSRSVFEDEFDELAAGLKEGLAS